jgi:hypothetical protein
MINRMVLIVDVPHGHSDHTGHIFLVSSLDALTGLSETDLLPLLREARGERRARNLDGIAVSREAIQAGIESNRHVQEILLLRGLEISALSAAQIETGYRKLEQRLGDVQSLSSAEVTDRRGSLHLCPTLAGWLELDDFAACLAPAISGRETAVKPAAKPPVATTARTTVELTSHPSPRLLLPGRLLPVCCSVLALTVLAIIVASNGHLLVSGVPKSNVGGGRSSTATDPTQQAGPDKEYQSVSDSATKIERPIPETPSTRIELATAELEQIEKKKGNWGPTKESYLALANNRIAYNLEGGKPEVLDALRKRFMEGLFDAARKELSAISRTTSQKLPPKTKPHQFCDGHATVEVIATQGRQIVSVLTYFEDQRSILENCAPRDTDSEDFKNRLKSLASQALWIHYDSVHKLLDNTILHKDSPSITIAAATELIGLSFDSLAKKQLLDELKTAEREFRQQVKCDESNPLSSLSVLTFEIKQSTKSAQFKSVSFEKNTPQVDGKPKLKMAELELGLPTEVYVEIGLTRWTGIKNDMRIVTRVGRDSDTKMIPGALIELQRPPDSIESDARRSRSIQLALTVECQLNFDRAVDWLAKFREFLNKIEPKTNGEPHNDSSSKSQ